MSDFNIQFIGTGGTTPSAYRGLPATLVTRNGHQTLVDCGEGTQRQLMLAQSLGHFDVVAITHFHADHWYGLPGLIKTWELQDREKPLTIVVPDSKSSDYYVHLLKELIGSKLSFSMCIALASSSVYLQDDYRLVPFETSHTIASNGYQFVEDSRRGRLDVDLARELGVTDKRDYGKLTKGHNVTSDDGSVVHSSQVMGASRSGRSVMITGDTRALDPKLIARLAPDVLVHDAAFLECDRGRATTTRHSTAYEAGRAHYLAKKENPNLDCRLFLTHTGSKYTIKDIFKEARSLQPSGSDVFIPRDFDLVDIPLKD